MKHDDERMHIHKTEQENDYYWDRENPRYNRGGHLDIVAEEIRGEAKGDMEEAEGVGEGMERK